MFLQLQLANIFSLFMYIYFLFFCKKKKKENVVFEKQRFVLLFLFFFIKIWQNLESSQWDIFPRDRHLCKLSEGNYLSIVNHPTPTVPGNQADFPKFADGQIQEGKEREEEEKEMRNERKEKEKGAGGQQWRSRVLNESELV